MGLEFAFWGYVNSDQIESVEIVSLMDSHTSVTYWFATTPISGVYLSLPNTTSQAQCMENFQAWSAARTS